MYGRQGQRAWVHEPVKWFGESIERAIYQYSESPDWASATGWSYTEPELMGQKARRFIISISAVRRPSDAYCWELDLLLRAIKGVPL